MLDWITEHRELLLWAAASAALLIGVMMVLVPALVIRIPHDYFAHEKRPASLLANLHPFLRIGLRIGKNALGAVLVVTGLVMLMLPGPGMLTILLGFLMVEFPGKYRLEKWVVGRRPVRKAVNWLRIRYGRPLLTPPTSPPPADPAET